MGRKLGGMFTLVVMLLTFFGVTQWLFVSAPVRLFMAALGCTFLGGCLAFAVGFGLFMLFTRGEG